MASSSSVAQSCPTLCNPMDCSTPGLPVPLRDSHFENPRSSMKRQKDTAPENEPPGQMVPSMLQGKSGGQLLVDPERMKWMSQSRSDTAGDYTKLHDLWVLLSRSIFCFSLTLTQRSLLQKQIWDRVFWGKKTSKELQ